MKRLVLLVMIALAACNTATTPSGEEPLATVTASSITQSKTSVKTWNIIGNGSNIAVRGVDGTANTIHALESLRGSDGSVKATFTFRTSSTGAPVTRSFTIGKNGKPVSGVPIQAVDDALCPDCMGDDLKVGLSAQLQPQVASQACRDARRALTRAINSALRSCRENQFGQIVDEVGCLQAEAAISSAQSDVDQACGSN